MMSPKRIGGEEKSRYSVRVLDRAFLLLDILAENPPLNLVSVSAAADLDTSTTFRLLAALQDQGYVSKHSVTGNYSLGVACVELAHAFLNRSVQSIAMPHLMALRDETKETVHLAVFDMMEVVYVDKQEGLHAVGLTKSRIGGRNQAYCSGVGKAMLAYRDQNAVRKFYEENPPERLTSMTLATVEELMTELEAIRQRGYAFDYGENEPEVRCVAAPIFDSTGTAVAALSVSGTGGRMDPLPEQTDLIEKVLATAATVSRSLGGATPVSSTPRELAAPDRGL